MSTKSCKIRKGATALKKRRQRKEVKAVIDAFIENKKNIIIRTKNHSPHKRAQDKIHTSMSKNVVANMRLK